ncbi:hypothetical protein D9613_000776 [Agrocybe pediades]|uniref:Cytochrome P450 n=1 Tax=Agrocybe pediades TaxID=84607 RepID=A0A8H4VSX5_9AGAR|nr:hypothetical protein D9613_000776 [Agrocybe pediades]
MEGIPLLLLTVGLLYVIHKALAFHRAVRSVDNLPGYRVLFSQFGLPTFVFGRWRGISPGTNHFFEDKHSTFGEWDMNTVISALPSPLVTLTIADADTIKEITSSRARFPKPVYQYEVLSFFGRNIVASEGEEWKKYRKISAPAFSDRNNKLVWEETVRIMDSLFADLWKDKDVISLDHCVEITLPIALFVIGVAGFGRRISWRDDEVVPAGHTMSFKESLHIASSDVFMKVFLPNAAMKLTGRTRRVQTAFAELEEYMLKMIHERHSSEKVERHDLLSSLLDANNDDFSDQRLLDSELVGNIFIFLLAGHETTAHTLSFTFGFLALYQDEQEKLYQHIKSVLSDGRMPTYEDMPLLTYSMAVFYETLRLFPPVVNIPKYNPEDTVLTVGNQYGEKRTVPVPKNTWIAINTPGLHYNPRYWENPEEFKPSRFLKEYNKDAFIPFSAGARACLGRKFFETEGIAVLTMMVLNYKITVKEEPQFAGETFEQTKARIFQTKNALTLTPIRVPLTFTRRT